jgi:hypothetical protein
MATGVADLKCRATGEDTEDSEEPLAGEGPKKLTANGASGAHGDCHVPLVNDAELLFRDLPIG